MKLNFDRTEERVGFILRSTVHYLHVSLEVTQGEQALIEKNNWGDLPACTAVFIHTHGMEWTMFGKEFIGKTRKLGFKDFKQLTSAERQILESVEKLILKIEEDTDFAAGAS